MKRDPLATVMIALALCLAALALGGALKQRAALRVVPGARDSAIPAGPMRTLHAVPRLRSAARGATMRPEEERAMNAVFGLVPDARAAARTVVELKSAGFGADDVCVVFPETADVAAQPTPSQPAAPAPLLVGATLAGPPPAAGLAAFAARGLADVLAHLGVAIDAAARLQQRVEDGGILISVHAESGRGLASARAVLAAAGALDIGVAGALAD
ncbi:MAG: hypothetical protein HY749_24650 [Gammaproteobacteria bacterium]|nr:hypothetical protein [Gammaproteobacteria bacterium]MBI5619163.1 hypothetical protein [Gammaproteobacteria bacterium]